MLLQMFCNITTVDSWCWNNFSDVVIGFVIISFFFLHSVVICLFGCFNRWFMMLQGFFYRKCCRTQKLSKMLCETIKTCCRGIFLQVLEACTRTFVLNVGISFLFEAYARILIIRCYMKHGIHVAMGIFQLFKHLTLASRLDVRALAAPYVFL